MPSSNHTTVDSDYTVSNPPPGGSISPPGTVTAGAITATVGALMMLGAFTVGEAAALFYLGFGITIAGVTGVAYGLKRIKREGLCTLAATNFLPQNSYDDCPQVWPVEEGAIQVTFFETGTQNELATATVSQPNALVSLVNGGNWLEAFVEENEALNAVQVFHSEGEANFAALVFAAPS